jgi:DNA modification methylase
MDAITLKPTYQDKGIELYLGDCLEIMKTIPDKSIDLVLTDPPYGIGADKGVGGAYKKVENTKGIGMCDLLKNILMRC